MESLETIFKDTKKRMQRGVFDRDYESQRKVTEIIKQMQEEILAAFTECIVPYKYQGVLEQALAELRDIVNSINTRPTQEMCDRATGIVARTKKKIEEDRDAGLTSDERKKGGRQAFKDGREGMCQSKRDVDCVSAEKRLGDAVQTAFNKIKKASIADIGLSTSDMFSVNLAVDQVFNVYPERLNQLFGENIDAVDVLICKEFAELEEAVIGRVKNENLKPWDLRNFGTSQREVQEKIADVAQAAKDAQDKLKERSGSQLNTDFTI